MRPGARRIAETQELLHRYGYDVAADRQLDERTSIIVRAFQLHFRPSRADGRLDAGTLDTASRLLAALPVPVTS